MYIRKETGGIRKFRCHIMGKMTSLIVESSWSIQSVTNDWVQLAMWQHTESLYSYDFYHKIERIWVKINKQVNYPIKMCILEMQNDHTLRTDDPADPHCFCASWLALGVSRVGMTPAVQAWNDHPIPGVFTSCTFNPFHTHTQTHTCMYVYTLVKIHINQIVSF